MYSIYKWRFLMLRQPEFTKSDVGSYADIGHRIQKIISDPKVQRTQMVTVTRLPTDKPDAWRRVLAEISETAGIQVDKLDDQVVRIGWREYCEA
jgi:hypothetical protein